MYHSTKQYHHGRGKPRGRCEGARGRALNPGLVAKREAPVFWRSNSLPYMVKLGGSQPPGLGEREECSSQRVHWRVSVKGDP